MSASFEFITTFFNIRPPPKLYPVLGLLEQYMTPTLDVALLCSSRSGSDLGHKLDRFEKLSLHSRPPRLDFHHYIAINTTYSSQCSYILLFVNN